MGSKIKFRPIDEELVKVKTEELTRKPLFLIFLLIRAKEVELGFNVWIWI